MPLDRFTDSPLPPLHQQLLCSQYEGIFSRGFFDPFTRRNHPRSNIRRKRTLSGVNRQSRNLGHIYKDHWLKFQKQNAISDDNLVERFSNLNIEDNPVAKETQAKTTISEMLREKIGAL
jgi:hypothetical protein